MKKYIGLLVLLMAVLLLPTAAQGHALVKCSTKQTPQAQLKCGEMNVHLGITSLRFLRNHPRVGTVKSRHSVSRSAAYLVKYGNRHTESALWRMLGGMPAAAFNDSCLREVINREASGFRAEDRSTWKRAAQVWNGGHVAPWTSSTTYGGSGAYGIPQALPGSKMRSAGADWATNPVTQVKWMIGYVNNRYGGSCAALAHHNSAGYY